VPDKDVLLKLGFDEATLNAELEKLRERILEFFKNLALTTGNDAPINSFQSIFGGPDADKSREFRNSLGGLGTTIKDLRTQLETARKALSAQGLTEKEVNKETKDLNTAVSNLEKKYKDLNQSIAVTGRINDSQAASLIKLRFATRDATTQLGQFNVQQSASAVVGQRSNNFLQSFTFQAGVLGFALIRTGRIVEQFGVSMFQFIKGANEADAAVKVLRDSLESNDFTQGKLDQLRKSFKSVDEALRTAFGTNNIEFLKQAGFSTRQIIDGLVSNLSNSDRKLLDAAKSWDHLEISIRNVKNSVSQLFAPGLVSLDNFITTKLLPTVNNLVAAFDKLNPSTQSFISSVVIAIPGILIGFATLSKIVGLLISGAAILIKSFQFVSGAFTTISAGIAELSPAAGTTAFVGLGEVFETIASLAGPIGIVITLITALATDFGNLRTNVLSGLGDIYDAVVHVGTALSDASSRGSGLGLIFTKIGNLVALVVSILQGAIGILGGLLEGFFGAIGNFINLIADLITALSADTWTGVFTRLFNSIKAFLFNTEVVIAKFFTDIYISLAEAGLRLLRHTPGAEAIADQLESNIAGLHEYRDSIESVSFKVDANTGAVVRNTVEQKKLEAQHRNLVVSGDALQKSLHLMSLEFDAIVSKTLASDQALLKLNETFLNTATQLNIGGIQFRQGIEQSEDIKQLNELLNKDIDAFNNQLDSKFAALQSKILANIADISKEELRGVVNDAGTVFAQINDIISNQTDATAKNVRDVFPSLLQLLPDVLTQIQSVNNKAAQGVTITVDDVNKLRDAATNAIKALNEAQVSSVIPIDAAQKARETADAALKSAVGVADTIAKSLGKQANANATAVEQLKAQLKTLQDLGAERQRQLNEVDVVTPEKQRLIVLQQQLDTLNSLQTSEGFSVDRQQEIARKQKEILEIQDQIANAENINNDELRKKQIALDTNLKNLQQQVDLLKQQREIANGITKAFESARDAITDALRNLRSSRSEFLTGIGGFLGERGGTGLTSQVNQIQDQQTRAQFEALRRSLPSAGIPGLGDIGRDNLTELKAAIGSLNTFNGNFEFSIEKFIKLVADLSNTVNADLTSINFQIQQAEAQGRPEDVKTLRTQQAAILERANNLAKVTAFINGLLKTRQTINKDELDNRTLVFRQDEARLKILQEQLELERELVDAQLNNAKLQQQAPGTDVFHSLDPRKVDAANKAALTTEIELIKARISLRKDEIEIQRRQALLQAEANGATADQLKKINDLYDHEVDVLTQLGLIEVDNANLRAAAQSAADFKDELLNLLDLSESKLLTNLAARLKDFSNNIGSWAKSMKATGALLSDVVQVAFVGALDAIADALITFLESGQVGLKGLLAFFGSILISIGEQIIQMATSAIALAAIQGFIDGLPGGIFVALGNAAKNALLATAYMAPLIAIGAGLILAGSALGGSGKHTVKDTATANSGNSANSKTGATADNNFDPNKDIRTIFQKALMAQITIDIKTDDTQIVKTIVKNINQNGRLTTLIGNRKLQFGY
jgi:hypothetical protein